MDLPEEIQLSPLARVLIDALDPMNNPDGWQKLYDMVIKNQALVEQIMMIDPKAAPPHEEDDHDYVEAYIQQVTTQAKVAPPDTSRTNGSTDLLMNLYKANQQQGTQAAFDLLQKSQASSTVCKFDTILHEKRIKYMDKEKIIQAGEITAVIGQPGSGKSFWTLRKLADLADNMPVLYIAAEGINPERLYALMKFRETQGIPHTKKFSDNFGFYRNPLDLTSDIAVEGLYEQIKDLKPRVIAIDTFAACTPGIDENSSKDMQPVLNRIRTMLIDRLGCAVLLIHHTTKDGKSFRGSSALRGNVANMYYLIQDDDRIILRSDKQRDSEPSPDRYYRLVKFATRLDPDTDEQLYSAVMVSEKNVVDDPKKPKISRHQQTILETLADFENGLTTRSLQEATDISKATLWRNMQRLSRQNLIKTGERGEPVFITEAGRELLKQLQTDTK